MNARIFKKINKLSAAEIERFGVGSYFGDDVTVNTYIIEHEIDLYVLRFIYKWERKSVINDRLNLIGFKGYINKDGCIDALSALFRIAYAIDSHLSPVLSTKELFKFIKSIQVKQKKTA